jgi:hypothetical protein
MLPNVSLRAEAMLIAFCGITAIFYVGSAGGVAYLTRAERIAQALGMQFPIVATWRPKDVYNGVGQLDAILEFMTIRSPYNIANNQEQCDPVARKARWTIFWPTLTARFAH